MTTNCAVCGQAPKEVDTDLCTECNDATVTPGNPEKHRSSDSSYIVLVPMTAVTVRLESLVEVK
jgi:hypothetical protein